MKKGQREILRESAASHEELQREFTDATAQAEKRYKELQQHRDIFSKSTDVQHNLAHEAGAEMDGLRSHVSALAAKLEAAKGKVDSKGAYAAVLAKFGY